MSVGNIQQPKLIWNAKLLLTEQDCACSADVGALKVLYPSSMQNTDADCACSMQASSPSHLDNKRQSIWQISTDLRRQPLSREYELILSPLGVTSMAVANNQAKLILDTFGEPMLFDNLIDRFPEINPQDVLSTARNLAYLGFLTPQTRFPTDVTPHTLASWLHLTDRCNLRCDYCYLPHVREDMSPETGRAAIDATFRSALANGFKQVKLKYAGGEPLLRFPLIVELHRYAQSLAEKHGLGLEGVVLSNGTLLTAEMVKTLKSLGLRLMISLDGLGQHHDSHRPYAGGRGSFKDVSEAVDLVLANGLVPNISVTVSSRIADGLPEVMAWILERDLPFSLNFYRENELSASHEDMQLDEQKIVNSMLAAFKVIENKLPRRPFLGGIIDRANLSVSHTHTCGVGQNYLVFDQNGQVAKCQMHIRKPITDVHVADPLAVIRADQIGIQNLSVEEKEGCKTCEWKHWCAGGCPLATYRATGRYDVKSPNCNIYKALFPEALRLEGLRLLKYQDDPEVVQKIPA